MILPFPFGKAFCILPAGMNVVVYRFFSTFDSFGPTLLRLLLTVVFAIHGLRATLGLLGGPGWGATLAHWTSPDGPNVPYALAAGILAAEMISAAGLLLGFLTRLAALGIFAAAVVATTAAALQPSSSSVAGDETGFILTLATVALSLMFMGGGRFSFDRAISRQLLPF